MSSLDKLINLLEKLKQEDPDLSDKASKALDVLISEDSEEDEELSEDVFESAAPEEEPFDDSYVEILDEDLQIIVSSREEAIELIKTLGLLVQNYEADKERILEAIEKNGTALAELVSDLKTAYKLDINSGYTLILPSASQEKAAFVKNDAS